MTMGSSMKAIMCRTMRICQDTSVCRPVTVNSKKSSTACLRFRRSMRQKSFSKQMGKIQSRTEKNRKTRRLSISWMTMEEIGKIPLILMQIVFRLDLEQIVRASKIRTTSEGASGLKWWSIKRNSVLNRTTRSPVYMKWSSNRRG